MAAPFRLVTRRRFTRTDGCTLLLAIGTVLFLFGFLHCHDHPGPTHIEKHARSQLQIIMLALERYQEEYGYYPQLGAGATAADAVPLDRRFWDDLKDRNGRDIRDWQGAGLTSDSTYGFVDLWGKPWWYDGIAPVMTPGKYDLWSTGKDGRHGRNGRTPVNARTPAADQSDDITNWRLPR